MSNFFNTGMGEPVSPPRFRQRDPEPDPERGNTASDSSANHGVDNLGTPLRQDNLRESSGIVTDQNQTTISRPPPRGGRGGHGPKCLCGEKHWYSECMYLNQDLPQQDRKKDIEDRIKKKLEEDDTLRNAVAKNVEKSRNKADANEGIPTSTSLQHHNPEERPVTGAFTTPSSLYAPSPRYAQLPLYAPSSMSAVSLPASPRQSYSTPRGGYTTLPMAPTSLLAGLSLGSDSLPQLYLPRMGYSPSGSTIRPQDYSPPMGGSTLPQAYSPPMGGNSLSLNRTPLLNPVVGDKRAHSASPMRSIKKSKGKSKATDRIDISDLTPYTPRVTRAEAKKAQPNVPQKPLSKLAEHKLFFEKEMEGIEEFKNPTPNMVDLKQLLAMEDYELIALRYPLETEAFVGRGGGTYIVIDNIDELQIHLAKVRERQEREKARRSGHRGNAEQAVTPTSDRTADTASRRGSSHSHSQLPGPNRQGNQPKLIRCQRCDRDRKACSKTRPICVRCHERGFLCVYLD